jgi:hypothetical protein
MSEPIDRKLLLKLLGAPDLAVPGLQRLSSTSLPKLAADSGSAM